MSNKNDCINSDIWFSQLFTCCMHDKIQLYKLYTRTRKLVWLSKLQYQRCNLQLNKLVLTMSSPNQVNIYTDIHKEKKLAKLSSKGLLTAHFYCHIHPKKISLLLGLTYLTWIFYIDYMLPGTQVIAIQSSIRLKANPIKFWRNWR